MQEAQLPAGGLYDLRPGRPIVPHFSLFARGSLHSQGVPLHQERDPFLRQHGLCW